MQTWHVYLLRCADNSLYCGITNNLDRRLAAHNAGTASKYTRARLPVRLEASVTVDGKSAALRLEIAIKKIPACRKIKRLLEAGNIS
ncbi:GIY-YIG nuclease family protein [Desulfovibrio sp. Fe33]|uniref:GIY-YIG nuclease family protein n=1 Tax=Desulfovibrio sp. Fe33 TaxID=3020842 RepID=UPI00234D3EA9|nr:GIY-YIG nuclease family protein [Desulfovibrio sp. Fe33]